MGKFAIITEEAESPSSPIGYPETASKETQSQNTSDSVDDTFTLKVEQPRRRGRQRATTQAQKFVGEAAANPADYKMWSAIFLGSANTVVVTWLGQDCAMEQREADMMEPPLARMLSRMPASASQKMSTFIDPMVMLIALGMWGNRIIRVQKSKRENTITQAEFDRAIGVTDNSAPPAPSSRSRDNRGRYIPVQPSQDYPMPEPPLPNTQIEVNPNGIPVAISDQIGDV